MVAASALVSVFAVARIVFAPVGGWAVGRFGETRVFCAGLAVVVASSTACAFASGYPQLLAYRAAGASDPRCSPSRRPHCSSRIALAALRGRAAGVWATGFLSGSIAGPVVGGWLLSGDLRAPFLAYAATLVVAALSTGWTLRRSSGRYPTCREDERPHITFADALSALLSGPRWSPMS